jgi:hypothetical protein
MVNVGGISALSWELERNVATQARRASQGNARKPLLTRCLRVGLVCRVPTRVLGQGLLHEDGTLDNNREDGTLATT